MGKIIAALATLAAINLVVYLLAEQSRPDDVNQPWLSALFFLLIVVPRMWRRA
jgi:hypothetical protein